jgi:ribosomal protein S18 acetylase RimI-like enzyme
VSVSPELTVTARRAGAGDLPVLTYLYRELEAEMGGLSDMWAKAEGLAEPISAGLAAALDDPSASIYLGEIDGYPFGFLLARVEGLLPQAGGEQVGSIRLVYVEPEARGVGVGEALREAALADLRARGLRRFDAHVLPGHRLAKNFFEQGGFSARAIVMHHRDE